jgi:hypothetical protein
MHSLYTSSGLEVLKRDEHSTQCLQLAVEEDLPLLEGRS